MFLEWENNSGNYKSSVGNFKITLLTTSNKFHWAISPHSTKIANINPIQNPKLRWPKRRDMYYQVTRKMETMFTSMLSIAILTSRFFENFRLFLTWVPKPLTQRRRKDVVKTSSFWSERHLTLVWNEGCDDLFLRRLGRRLLLKEKNHMETIYRWIFYLLTFWTIYILPLHH